jgi:hypothetical protein
MNGIICVFNPVFNSFYQDYGAIGDGVHDDAAAIK